jgi:hypothetical protein
VVLRCGLGNRRRLWRSHPTGSHPGSSVVQIADGQTVETHRWGALGRRTHLARLRRRQLAVPDRQRAPGSYSRNGPGTRRSSDLGIRRCRRGNGPDTHRRLSDLGTRRCCYVSDLGTRRCCYPSDLGTRRCCHCLNGLGSRCCSADSDSRRTRRSHPNDLGSRRSSRENDLGSRRSSRESDLGSRRSSRENGLGSRRCSLQSGPGTRRCSDVPDTHLDGRIRSKNRRETFRAADRRLGAATHYDRDSRLGHNPRCCDRWRIPRCCDRWRIRRSRRWHSHRQDVRRRDVHRCRRSSRRLQSSHRDIHPRSYPRRRTRPPGGRRVHRLCSRQAGHSSPRS